MPMIVIFIIKYVLFGKFLKYVLFYFNATNLESHININISLRNPDYICRNSQYYWFSLTWLEFEKPTVLGRQGSGDLAHNVEIHPHTQKKFIYYKATYII